MASKRKNRIRSKKRKKGNGKRHGELWSEGSYTLHYTNISVRYKVYRLPWKAIYGLNGLPSRVTNCVIKSPLPIPSEVQKNRRRERERERKL